jgi:murein L,D-transpeptidase YafK
MIHGLPNDPRHSPDYYASQDWTDGCIAVTNADMVEIWMMTSDNVRIDIQPVNRAGRPRRLHLSRRVHSSPITR